MHDSSAPKCPTTDQTYTKDPLVCTSFEDLKCLLPFPGKPSAPSGHEARQREHGKQGALGGHTAPWAFKTRKTLHPLKLPPPTLALTVTGPGAITVMQMGECDSKRGVTAHQGTITSQYQFLD